MNLANTEIEQSDTAIKKGRDWKIIGFWYLIIINAIMLLTLVFYFQIKVKDWVSEIKPQINDLNNSYIDLYYKYSRVDDIEKNQQQFYVMQKKDLEEIKSLILYIKTDNDKMSERISQETSTIVDKVNLYVSIAVVLLTLIGIFIPLIVQNMGNHQIQEKYDELKKDFGEKNNKISKLDKQLVNLSKSYKEIDAKTEHVDELNEKIKVQEVTVSDIENNLKQLPPVRIMFYLHKVLDLNDIRYYSQSMKTTYEYFLTIINSIKCDIEKCKETKVASDDSVLLQSLNSFIIDCKSIKVYGYTRSAITILKSLEEAFSIFIQNEIVEDEQKYNLLILSLENTISKLNEVVFDDLL